MHSTNKLTLSRQSVDRLPVADREIVYWDQHLPGFGVRVYATGSKVYIAHARSGGKTRRVAIGRHGAWSTERARREAGALIADIKAGRTPGRPGADSASTTGPTIAGLADDYMTQHVALRCKPSTRDPAAISSTGSSSPGSGRCASARSRPITSPRCTTGAARRPSWRTRRSPCCRDSS